MNIASYCRDDIERHLDEQKVIVVFGVAGAGKTTFVKNYLSAAGVDYRYVCPERIGQYACEVRDQVAVFDEICQLDKRTLKMALDKRINNSNTRTFIIAQFIGDLKGILDLENHHCVIQIQSDGSVCIY